jgi:hypothetical protein
MLDALGKTATALGFIAAACTILTTALQITKSAPSDVRRTMLHAIDARGRPCQAVSLSFDGASVNSGPQGIVYVPSAWAGASVIVTDTAAVTHLGLVVVVPGAPLTCGCQSLAMGLDFKEGSSREARPREAADRLGSGFAAPSDP